ncbi:MAG: M23 family metallopeptidase [Ruminococcaceae bacterium]|nr:M23 family metallopeptidase [Oscillospiraceae bacterium]
MNNEKNKNTNKKFKIAYAFTFIIAIAALMFTKISSEKSLGNISSLENSTTEKQITTTEKIVIEETVRQNLTNIPDTREVTEENKETEKDKYNKPYSDYYCLPFGNQIIKDYSNMNPVYSKTLGDWRTHNGIDFSGEAGGAVVAISYGEVISIYEDTLFGTCVLIDHGNGVTAKYCGLNKDTLNVKEHSSVNSEDIIGYLGEIPCEKQEGAHLHFEITHNGELVEPLELMGK